LLDPAQTSHLERRAVQVHANLMPGKSSHDFAPATDGPDLVVDEDRGVLLELSALAVGHKIAHCEIVEITFDQSIPVETFRLDS
jgi:hypothetical protein